MNLTGKTTIITGGGSGIGAALARRFSNEGAQVVIADIDADAAQILANDIGGIGVKCDVTCETDIQSLVKICETHFGPIDLFCSNAGAFWGEPDHAASASNDVWQKNWDLHVMSHVYAARTVLPGMIERGSGYLLQMSSAAGVLNQIGDAAYSASKSAAVSFAQSLAISHGDQGIKVSVICPQYVATPMLGYSNPEAAKQYTGVLTPDQVAETVMQGIDNEQFLILPHPQVEGYLRTKTDDPDAWLRAMQKLRRRILETSGEINLDDMHKLI